MHDVPKYLDDECVCFEVARGYSWRDGSDLGCATTCWQSGLWLGRRPAERARSSS